MAEPEAPDSATGSVMETDSDLAMGLGLPSESPVVSPLVLLWAEMLEAMSEVRWEAMLVVRLAETSEVMLVVTSVVPVSGARLLCRGLLLRLFLGQRGWFDRV